MDERWLSWLQLLPHAAAIAPWRAPDELVEQLGARASRHADTVLAWRPQRADLAALAHARALVLVNPHGIGRTHLKAIGLPHIRAFAVVPSLRDARWFIPLQSGKAQLRAWDLYTPYQQRARLQRAIVRLLARGGAGPGDRVVLALPAPAPLELQLAAVVGRSDFSIASATGTPGPQRKITMQIATQAGEILAYVKLADRAATAELVQREARFLEYLSALGLQNALAPRLLHHGRHDNGYLMVTEPLPAWLHPSGPTLQSGHASALRELAMQRGANGTSALVQRLGQRIRYLQTCLEPGWVDRLGQALVALNRATDIVNLPTTLAHGDFAPWNVRVDRRATKAAMFDWEQGQAEQFLLWDAFHFETMVRILVRRERFAAGKGVLAAVRRLPLIQAFQISAAQARALYIAYLADMSAHWVEARRDSSYGLVAADDEQMMRGQLLDGLLAEP
jgi:Phosphotransferase enzyme family